VPLEQEQLQHKESAMDALDQLENDVVQLQRRAAQPKIHHYRLTSAMTE